MEEEYILQETAQLAKEKGFNEACGHYYMNRVLHHVPLGIAYISRSLKNTELNIYKGAISAPTQSFLAKWLREEKNIFIDVWNNASGYSYQLYKANNGTTIYTKNHIGPNDGGQWDTYEEALEAGIKDTLRRI